VADPIWEHNPDGSVTLGGAGSDLFDRRRVHLVLAHFAPDPEAHPSLGGAFAVLIDRAIDLVQTRAACRAGGDVEASPWGIYFGVAVDLFSDGVIIGTGSIINPALGVLLALGQVPADIPEGFATIATFKNKGVPRAKRVLLSASFAIPILVGGFALFALLASYFE
jgi:zinc transporter ZupT